MIQGLIDGIRSKIAAIGDVMRGVADKIKGFLPGSPVKEGPLVSWNRGGAGKRLGGMLAEGLDASRATVAAASARMAASVASPSMAVAVSADQRAGAYQRPGATDDLVNAIRQAMSGWTVEAYGRELGRLVDTYHAGYGRR